MKKTILAIMIIAIGFTSCKKDSNDSEQAINISSLPVNVTQYVDNNYPDASILQAVTVNKNKASYILTLNTDEELAFDKNGSFVGNGEEFHQGEHQDKHHAHHGHHHHGNVFNSGIPIDSLSSSITGYISINYAGYTIKHAEIDTNCQSGAVIEVVIFNTSFQHLKLYFDQSGTYLMSSSRLMYVNLPLAVKTNISTNYTTFIPKIVALKLDLANNTVAYYVYLFDGQTRKRVYISDTGTVICEQ